ncbi:MAG: DNA-directed DNA polymerase II small subunit [Candidatus Bilamarchaeaceae archaeon]
MTVMDSLAQNEIRLSVEAEELLKKNEHIIDKVLSLNKPFITKDDVEAILNESKPVEVEFKKSDFLPEAKNYNADIRVLHQLDVTSKSRTRGEVENFVNYFRNRYERLARIMRTTTRNIQTLSVNDAKRRVGERVRIVVMVTEKRKTQKGNLFLEVEDESGSFKVIFSGGSQKKAETVALDDVVAITGKVLEPYMIADDVEWPDIPVTREKRLSERDLAIAYISDIHFGSNNFLSNYLERFVRWLYGEGDESARKIASKVKYIIVAGDVVDGIGVYPKQEKELSIKDIYKQYEMFDNFVHELPDYIDVIVCPGNHDAVRRGEPMPAIPKEFIKTDVVRIGSPSYVVVDGIKHLVYHGTSIDSFVANIPGMSYAHPEKVMVEYLRRRHLSPVYGENLIVPENIDYLVVEEIPDVIHCGHVHKNSYAQYRNVMLINSGTFQARTEYQIKQGHVPTPGFVPVYELKTGRLRTLDFTK